MEQNSFNLLKVKKILIKFENFEISSLKNGSDAKNKFSSKNSLKMENSLKVANMSLN